jgi:hypothetical protein
MRIFLFYWLIFILCSCKSNDYKENKINFAEHIGPIFHQKCAPCHHKGQVGPIELIRYEEIKKRAKLLLRVMESGYMPPWPADPTYSRFVGELFLRKGEIDSLRIWINEGMLAGPLDQLKIPAFSSSNSSFGQPDFSISFKEKIPLKGDGLDDFFLVKIPFEFPTDTFVKMIEFVPGNSKLVHHVNGHIIQYDHGAKKDLFQKPYYLASDTMAEAHEVYSQLKVQNDDASFPMLTQSVVNYLPGVMSRNYPDGIGGFKLRKSGYVLFRDIHYGPSYRDTSDSSFVNFYFGPEQDYRPFVEIQMGTLGITDIVPPLYLKPGDKKTFYSEYIVPQKLSLITINPHMHKLGVSFLAYAVSLSGDTIPLIRIPKWDFNWQFFYTFQKPVVLEKGTKIRMEGLFDNTINNPNNPFHPPQIVSERAGSMRTTDEMFQFIISALPYRFGDEDINLDNVPRGTNVNLK